MKTKEDLTSAKLPKWPQMLVTGTTLPAEQALEIIRRTDCFFCGCSGNDRNFISKARKLCYMPICPSRNSPAYRNPDGTENLEEFYKDIHAFSDRENEWREAWGIVSSEYITNDWISCPFTDGPYGWCHPDGTIGFTSNVGKWPSVDEIYNEWYTVAQTFPFVELEVTLMSDEEGCGGSPIVSFLIRNGRVEIIDPDERDIHSEFNRDIPKDRDFAADFEETFPGGLSKENAIPLEQIKAWGDAFIAVHPEFAERT